MPRFAPDGAPVLPRLVVPRESEWTLAYMLAYPHTVGPERETVLSSDDGIRAFAQRITDEVCLKARS